MKKKTKTGVVIGVSIASTILVMTILYYAISFSSTTPTETIKEKVLSYSGATEFCQEQGYDEATQFYIFNKVTNLPEASSIHIYCSKTLDNQEISKHYFTSIYPENYDSDFVDKWSEEEIQ